MDKSEIDFLPIRKGALVRLVNYQYLWDFDIVRDEVLSLALGFVRIDNSLKAFGGPNLGDIARVEFISGDTIYYRSLRHRGAIPLECVVPLFHKKRPTIAFWRRLKFTKKMYIDGLISPTKQEMKGILK